MIRHAAGQKNVHRILIGLGGSATNDGGVGMADALGALLLDADEEPLPPCPAGLDTLAIIDRDQILEVPPVDVACDVDNPVLGPNGATAIFGPQKGADEATRKRLEDFLDKLVKLTGAADLAETPGAGAAGGLGFGLMYFLKAKLHPGFELVSDALDLPSRIAQADLVITGEGSLDAQSLSGKGPVGIARLAKGLGKPVVAVAGHITDEVRQSGLFEHCAALSEFDLPLETLMSEAAELLTRKVRALSDLLPLHGEA
jgi:glycerate kinase